MNNDHHYPQPKPKPQPSGEPGWFVVVLDPCPADWWRACVPWEGT